MIYLELFVQFSIISMLAFGGGNAALSLLERISVQEMHWITPQDFAAAIGFAYVTPGPILITAAFIGYRAGGFFGSVVATVCLSYSMGFIGNGFVSGASLYGSSVVAGLWSWRRTGGDRLARDNRIQLGKLRVL